MQDAAGADCIIVAVAHNEFRAMSLDDIDKLYGEVPQNEKVLIDVKGLYKTDDVAAKGFAYWRL